MLVWDTQEQDYAFEGHMTTNPKYDTYWFTTQIESYGPGAGLAIRLQKKLSHCFCKQYCNVMTA